MKLLLTLSFMGLSVFVGAQTVEQIKAQRETYIWGEGTGATLSKADQDALLQIITQVSAQVESRFTLLKDEVISAGKANFTEEARLIMNTYSNATLTNTERIVLSNEPNARVFRYIRRSELSRIFEQRKRKIMDFTAMADEFTRQGQIADALKYYYWALTLLRSHPDGAYIQKPYGTDSVLLVSYIPQRMNEIFNGLRYVVGKVTDEPNYRMVTLYVTCNGKPVVNLEYSYWDGRDWSQPVMAKDGVGYLEFFGPTASQRYDTQIKVEYICEAEARIDRELEDVMHRLEHIPYKNSYTTLKLENNTPTAELAATMPSTTTTSTLPINRVADIKPYSTKVNQVIAAVLAKQTEQVRSLFTPEGFDTYNRLLAYGNARPVQNADIVAVRLNGEVICRGPKMSFSFANSTRRFVEDVVFHFDSLGKISAIAFGLSNQALESIVNNSSWSEPEKFTIINFLEHYKTAYALKRLNYISSIFSDDALIIVGSMVKPSPKTDNPFANNPIVRYNRYSKEQYIKNLRHAFASNEFINIQFEESNLLKASNGSQFGIQIKQNYFSSNYADQGYLFLLVDVTQPDTPIIHVRTWQPEKNPDGSIYGLEDF